MKVLALAIAIPVALFTAGCSEETAGPLPVVDRIEVTAGANQTTAQNSTLPERIVVRVMKDNGDPLAGVRIDWRVLEGGGSIVSADTTTDADGRATAQWAVGSGTGQNLLAVLARGASTTVRAFSERRFVAVTAGERHTCALSSTGEAFCWGRNDSGQLGDGTFTLRATPVPVLTGLRFKSISAGYAFTCAIDLEGSLYCWGDNREGQLGRPGPSTRLPTKVASTLAFKAISSGFLHSCAIASNDEAYCWGSNATGRLGTGDRVNSLVPVKVAGSTAWASISAGEMHSCGVATDGVAYCWGWHSNGELGTGAAYGVFAESPARVAGATLYKSISAGMRHTCAIATDDAVWCWGRSGAGEVGTPVFQNTIVPNPLPGGLRFESVGTGNVNSCGIGGTSLAGPRTTLAVYCWGSDGFNSNLVPTLIFNGPDASLAVGVDHVCAARDGAVWCWGSNNSRQLGNATFTAAGSAQPVKATLPVR